MSVTTVSTVMQEAVNNVPRNDIINGGLVVNQENQTAPADDAYTIGDLFLHVGEGTPVMSLETTGGPQGDRKWQKMVLDVNSQGGLVYFMSNDDCQDYIANGALSFGVQLRTVTGALVSNARIGILKWTSTVDTLTSDVVGTWASDGTDPTLATNWSYENTPSNLALTNAWQRFTVENVTVDSDTNNIAIFIWTDDGTITASDVIGFSEWQCNPGATVNDFSQPATRDTEHQVWEFYESMTDKVALNDLLCPGMAVSGTAGEFLYRWRSEKRIAPTVTITSKTLFACEKSNGAAQLCTNLTSTRAGLINVELAATVSTGLTAGHATFLIIADPCDVEADARF